MQAPRDKTAQTYSRIKELGLETVIWQEYSGENLSDSIGEIEKFIQKNNPCLFIHTPVLSGLKKDFLFNVGDLSGIRIWINQNEPDLLKYSYLITTQIGGVKDGYIGSIFSDGQGRIYCETVHEENICNQRMLSSGKNKSDGENLFTCEGTFFTNNGGKLSVEERTKIFLKYRDLQGYFEFVKGIQGGHIGIYTTGYEPLREFFKFPENVFNNEQANIPNRLQGHL